MSSGKSEAELRAAKDTAMRVVTEQQRVLGVPVPGGRVVEDFVNPIIDKIANDTSTPASAIGALERDPEVTEECIGTYTMGSGISPRQPTALDRLHQVVQQLMKLPAWNASLTAARDICKRHQVGGVVSGCTFCERREDAIRTVLLKAYQKYGNPWRKAERKIIVSR